MLSAKLTFKARVLELGRGQEDSWGAYISSKLQMLPESGSVIQSCCHLHGARDTQKVICHLIIQHIMHVLSSLFHRLPQPLRSPRRGKGTEGRFVSLISPPPLYIKSKEEAGI